jgi:hypothetical protein
VRPRNQRSGLCRQENLTFIFVLFME